MEEYASSGDDFGEARKCFTQFFTSYYRETDAWENEQRRFEHVKNTLETLLESYLEADVFGGTELTALKYVTQGENTVGVGKTQERIRETSGAPELRQHAVELVDADIDKGIVGGQAYHVQSVEDQAETELIEAFTTLTDDSATTSDWDEAIRSILDMDIDGVGLGTWSPVFCLLRPTQYPIVNNKIAEGMAVWFDREISLDAGDYFETITALNTIRKDFGFEDHFRQLDWFIHWADELTEVQSWYEENDIEGRTVWQINAGQKNENEPARLWPVWRDAGVCSIGWDIGDLETLSESEIESAVSEEHGENVSEYLKRFGKEIQPGQVIIARVGQKLLGIGVTQANGYQYCGDWMADQTDGIVHPHVWPVEWYVLPEDRLDTGEWDLSRGLHPRETLVRVKNFEELRLTYANRDPAAMEKLGSIEESVRSPSTADLPAPCTSAANLEAITDPAPYYWVNQGLEEVNGEYLRAPTKDLFQYDLPKLDIGDTVFSYNDGEILGYHTVAEPARVVQVPVEKLDDPETESGTEPRYRVETSFTWFEEPLFFASVLEALLEHRLEEYYPVNPGGINQQYLFNLSEAAGEYLLERGGAPGTDTARLDARLALPSFDVSLPDDLLFPGEAEQLQRQITAALTAGKHIIFTGPPGTGKSRLARAVAEQATGTDEVDGYTFTTATAEWSGFDTVGGYVPAQADAELEFDPRLVLRSFRDEDERVHNQWLVIDELNRANIDKALGPLFSVLGGDSVDLPYEREEQVRVDRVDADTSEATRAAIASNPDRFPVTPAWRLLGTMNTFDKTSLYDLSFAFMRRFSFIHVGVPALSNDGIVDGTLLDPSGGTNYIAGWEEATPGIVATAATWFEELSVVWATVNEYRPIGPAIVRDMLRHLDAFEGGDQSAPLTAAVINYVFPQLEGLRQEQQEAFLDALASERQVQTADGVTTVEPRLNLPYLRRKARDMFALDIPIQPTDG